MDVDTRENIVENVDINITDNGAFDNYTIIKEFSNILNVSDEEFLHIVPILKKLQQRQWILMFDFIKQSIYEGIIQDMNAMWLEENMPQKLDILARQKEKFTDTVNSQQSWRPQLADVGAQLKSFDLAVLNKKKKLLSTIAEKYECQTENLMAVTKSKRLYIKALHLDMQRYLNKTDVLFQNLAIRLENKHNKAIEGKKNIILYNMKWSDKDLEIEEKDE